MSKKALRLGDYLQHMRDAADRVQRYTADKSQNDFAADEQLQDAVVRNIEIIGEAAVDSLQLARVTHRRPQGRRHPSLGALVRTTRPRLRTHRVQDIDTAEDWERAQLMFAVIRQQDHR